VIELEVSGAVALFGPRRVGLLTIGCPGNDRVKDVEEFSKRINSFNTNLLQGRFVQWLAVIQRHKDDTIHAHIVVVSEYNLGHPAYWNEKRHKWCAAPTDYCRELWAVFTPERMAGYGLGVANLLPIQDAEAAGRYVARYVGRQLGSRKREDRHVRLVRYSQSWHRVVHGPFTWADWRAKRARRRAEELGVQFWGTVARMEADVGPAWKWRLRRTLYCSQLEYDCLRTAVDHDLESYGGVEFALADAWARCDVRAKEMERYAPASASV